MPRGAPTVRNRAERSCLLALILALLLCLPACVDDLDQNAIEPGQELTPTPTVAAVASPRPLPHAAPVSLPARRRIYFTQRGDLWQLPVDSAAAPVVRDKRILAFAPSPDASQVAVVFQGDTGAEEFAVVRDDSSVALHLPLVDQAGTPIAGAAGVNALAWSPRGDSIALARDDGSISIVGIDGTVRRLAPAHAGGHPGALAWSPDGQSLLYLDPALRAKAASLYAVPLSGGAPRALAESGGGERPVLAAAWLDAASLVYAQSKPGDIPHGGDLFQVDLAGGRPALLVSSGQFAPVAGVMALAVSENSRWLAFTVFVPGDDQPRFQGLWLLDLSTNRLRQIPTASGAAVTDLWWAAGVLLYRAVDEASSTVAGVYTGTEAFALYQYDPATNAPVERYRFREP
ncbi:MAG TPA: hypothetical protein VFI42_07630 [Thermomicrobiaceae bacterium]|nr:hypothetical protein [Thermomicrobiaceae bacterium]